MGSSHPLSFGFANAHAERPLDTRWGLLAGFVGDFSIRIRDRELYAEIDFPLAEFAAQLSRWIAHLGDVKEGGPDGPDFVFTSVESETEGLVRMVRTGADAWRVTAVDQSFFAAEAFPTHEVKRAGRELIRDVQRELQGSASLFDCVDDDTTREWLASAL